MFFQNFSLTHKDKPDMFSGKCWGYSVTNVVFVAFAVWIGALALLPSVQVL